MIVALTVLSMNIVACFAAQSFYISPSGSDSNDGSQASPFRSFQRARDAVRSLKTSQFKSGSITVYAEGGEYPPVGDAANPVLSLDPAQDSGSSDAMVSYVASDPSNPPVLLGGIPVPASAWTPAKMPADHQSAGGVFQADLASLGVSSDQVGGLRGGSLGQCASTHLMELFYEDKPMVLARYPNMNYSNPDLVLPSFLHINHTVTGEKNAFVAQSADLDHLDMWAKELEVSDQLWAGGYWFYGWADSYVQITAIDTKTGQVTSNKTTPPVYNYAAKARYFGVNLFCELDQPMEYYINTTTMTLYFMTPDGKAPSSTGYLSVAPEVVNLDSTSSAPSATARKQIREAQAEAEAAVRLQSRQRDDAAYARGTPTGPGTDLYASRRRDWDDVKQASEEATVRTMATMGIGAGVAKPLEYVRFRGLSIKYGTIGMNLDAANNVIVEDCDLSLHSDSSLTVDGSLNSVVNVVANYAGCRGISVAGGDQPSLTRGNNTVTGCSAQRYARWTRTYNPGLSFGGVGNTYSGNLVANAPHIGMIGGGNDHLFFNNTFERLVYEVSDSGAWYSGRSWAHRGSKLYNNTFLHCKDLEPTYLGSLATHGIYYDDQLSGHEAAYNTFIDLFQGVFVGGGRRHSVHDNYFEEVKTPFQMDDRGLTWQKANCNPKTGELILALQSLHYQQPPWSVHYPEVVNITLERPCVPVFNVINDNIWCPMNGTDFSNVSPTQAAGWNSTIENTTQHCR